jgi:hypothetical protein
MACFYCHLQGLNQIPDNGACAECGKASCAAPPVRKDKVFHASACHCGCGALVCRYDVFRHAHSEGGSVARCFPTTAIAASAAVISSISAELGEGRTAGRLSSEAVETMNEFLNFVTPGHDALLIAVERARDPGLRELTSRKTAAGPELVWIAFDAEFFVEGALDRVAALAADAMRTAWNPVPGLRRPHPELMWYDRRLRRVLDVLGVRQPLTTSSIEGLLQALAPRSVVPPPSLIRALAYTEIPTEASAIADWVVSATVSSAAPMANA